MATLTAGPSSSSSPFSNGGSPSTTGTIPSSPPDSPSDRNTHLTPSSSIGRRSKRRSGGFLLEPRSRNSHHGQHFTSSSPSNTSDRSHSPSAPSSRRLSGTTRVVSDATSVSTTSNNNNNNNSNTNNLVSAFFRSKGSERIKGKGRPTSLRAEDERLKELLARSIDGDTARIVELAGAISGTGESSSSSNRKNRKSGGGDDVFGDSSQQQQRRMTGTPGAGSNYIPSPGWGDIQRGNGGVQGFFPSQGGHSTPTPDHYQRTPRLDSGSRKTSATQVGAGGSGLDGSGAGTASPIPGPNVLRHKSLTGGMMQQQQLLQQQQQSQQQQQQPAIKISEHTLNRAQRAAHYIGLMAQYRTLLSNQPPLSGSMEGGAGRKYNPLQAIRNRRLRRNKLRLNPPLDETPWEDESVVSEWVESFPDYNTSGGKGYEDYLRQRPGIPGADEGTKDEDALGLGTAAAAAAAPRRVRRYKTDWYITPQELFADNYWAEENVALLEDRQGNKILRRQHPTSPVSVSVPAFPVRHPHHRQHSLHGHHHHHHYNLNNQHHHSLHGSERVDNNIKEEDADGRLRRKLKKHHRHHGHSSSSDLDYSESDSDVPGPEKTFFNATFTRKPSPPPYHTRHSFDPPDRQQEVSSPPAAVSSFNWNTSHKRSESPEKNGRSVSSTAAAPFKSAARKIQQTAYPKKGRTQSLDIGKPDADSSSPSKHRRNFTASNALLKTDGGNIGDNDAGDNILTPRAPERVPSFNVLLSPPLESDSNATTSATASASGSKATSAVPSARTSLDESRGRERKRDSITQELLNAVVRRRQSPTKASAPPMIPRSVSANKVNEIVRENELGGRSSSSLELKSMTDTTDHSPQHQQQQQQQHPPPHKSSKFGTVKKIRSGAGRVGELVGDGVAGVGGFLLGGGGRASKAPDSVSSASSPATSSDEGAGNLSVRKRMSVFGRRKATKQPIPDGNQSTDADDTDDDRGGSKLEKKNSNPTSNNPSTATTTTTTSTRKKFLYRLPRMPSAHHHGVGSAPPSPLRESQSFDEERPAMDGSGVVVGEDPIATQSKVQKNKRRPSRFSRLAPPEIETFRDMSRDRSPVRQVVIETMDQKAKRLEAERSRNVSGETVTSASSGSLSGAITSGSGVFSPDGDETPRDSRITLRDRERLRAQVALLANGAPRVKPTCRKQSLRLRAVILSTGTLCRGITSLQPRTSLRPKQQLLSQRFPILYQPEGGSALIERVLKRTLSLSTSISQMTSALTTSQTNYAHRTLSTYRGDLEHLRHQIDLDWYPFVQRMADEADSINAAVTTIDTLEVKKIKEMADIMIRKRGKGLRILRRFSYVVLEWLLLGIMYIAWLLVMIYRMCGAAVRGVVGGVRWFLWI